MKVLWSPGALSQVEAILDFIARDRPRAAAQFLEDLFERVDALADLPLQGRIVPELGREQIRELQFKGFRVIYRVTPSQIGILTVRHQRRRFDPDALG